MCAWDLLGNYTQIATIAATQHGHWGCCFSTCSIRAGHGYRQHQPNVCRPPSVLRFQRFAAGAGSDPGQCGAGLCGAYDAPSGWGLRWPHGLFQTPAENVTAGNAAPSILAPDQDHMPHCIYDTYMPALTLQTATLAACFAGLVMTIGFAARETRWGVPMMAVGTVGLLGIISYGIVSRL